MASLILPRRLRTEARVVCEDKNGVTSVRGFNPSLWISILAAPQWPSTIGVRCEDRTCTSTFPALLQGIGPHLVSVFFPFAQLSPSYQLLKGKELFGFVHCCIPRTSNGLACTKYPMNSLHRPLLSHLLVTSQMIFISLQAARLGSATHLF